MWHFQFQTQESPGQTRVAGSCYFPLIRFKQHGITSVMGQRARLPGLPCSEEGGGQMPLPLPLVSLAGVERPTPMAGLPAGICFSHEGPSGTRLRRESPPVKSVIVGWRSPGPLSSALAPQEN